MRTERIQKVFVAVAAVLAVAAVVKVVSLPMRQPNRAVALRDERLPQPYESLKPLHRAKVPPAGDDWLGQHPEHGETFGEYLASGPLKATPSRRTWYVQQVGALSPRQQELAQLSRDYVGRYFGLPVAELSPVVTDGVPSRVRRYNPNTTLDLERRPNQLLTTWVLEEVLVPGRPDDALGVIGLTGEDLYPHETWNFVFGQAMPQQRVGVWSLYRFGDPQLEGAAFDLALSRTLKLAVHEMGHMLSLTHCPAYECVMNGSNHLAETDSRPLEPCPACLAKLLSHTGADPIARFDALLRFWEGRNAPPGVREYLLAARTAALEAR